MLYSVMYSDEKRINNALPPLVLSCRALWVPSIPGFQKPLVLFLLRDRRRSPEPQWESSSCYNQKWHNVNKYTDYSAHLFCAMQLTSFIIPKTLRTPNTHSLSFVWIGVIEWRMWMACSGETSFWAEWLISPMYSCRSRRLGGGVPLHSVHCGTGRPALVHSIVLKCLCSYISCPPSSPFIFPELS